MRIIIDFDRTLYDTDRRIKHTYDLVKRYGISLADWKAAWPEMYSKNYFSKGLYSIWEHLRKYKAKAKLNSRRFLGDWVKQHQRHTYLFPETLDFLKSASRLGKLILITYGHKRFQKWKVEQSKIDKLFGSLHFVRVMKARGNFGRLLGKNELNVFLDDKALEIDEVKKNFPQVVAIHVRRPKTTHAGHVSKSKDFEVKNLREAKLIIETLAKKFIYNENQAVKALKKGQAVVYPTDTAYGLGVDATNVAAVKKMYEIKERGFKQPVHVIVSNLAMAKKYVKFNKEALKLFKKFLPGPLTIVCNLSPNLSPRQGRGVRLLSGETGTVGIRMPDNEIALSLARRLGRPITTTSANPSAHKSGGWTPYSAIDSFKQFYGEKYQPDLYLDAGILPKRKTSTIVRVVGNKIKVLRKGPIVSSVIASLPKGDAAIPEI